MAKLKSNKVSLSVQSAQPTINANYRSTHTNLFVDVAATTATVKGDGNYYSAPPRISGGSTYDFGTIGPSYNYVEHSAGWAWKNVGGDWINKAGVAQATSSPHFSIAANNVSTGISNYTTSILEGVNAAFSRGKWNAYIVKVSGGMRALLTPRSKNGSSKISVTYADGTTSELKCIACVQLMGGTSYSQVGSPEDAQINASVALEFEMPAQQCSSAILSLAVSQHSASSATISGFLANPTANAQPVKYGVAANYALDAGLKSDPSILFSQRFEDGTTLNDYVIPGFNDGLKSINVWDMNLWDPELFGTGAANTSKLPTAHLGTPIAGTHKWFYKQDSSSTVSLVNSSYTGENFAPSAAGLGALRIIIPKSTTADGGAVGYTGGFGSDLWALFPKNICGQIEETYVRFRVRFGVNTKPLSQTKQFRTATGATADYAIREGKWGVGTHHWTFYGGNNNVGGENLGHTNRLAFRIHPSDVSLMGLQPAIHSWDMIKYNLPFGNDGGLGAGFFPNRWYWVEIRKKLNTWNSTGPVGSSPSDGIMEIYIDGRLAATHTNWKYRDGKLDYTGETPINRNLLVPFRQMGDMGLLLNLYNGGVKPADEDTVMFFSQIACGTKYIGPSK